MSPIRQEDKLLVNSENRGFTPVPVPSEIGAKCGSPEFHAILSVLKERLPNSGFIYNAVKLSPRFPVQSKIFYINYPVEENEKETACSVISQDQTIILYSHFVEDHGHNVVISTPKNSPKYSEKKEEALIKIFSNSDHVIPWEEPHWIIAENPYLSRILTRIEVEVKGHSIEIHPDNLFIYNEQQNTVENIQHQIDQMGVSVRSLASSYEASLSFIKGNWAYHRANSHLPISRFIQHNERESLGVYAPGTGPGPASGFVLNGFGLISMLYTLEKERGKGYAQLGLKVGAQRLLEEGLVPTSSVEVCNERSAQLHEKLGFKRGPLVQWIMYRPTMID